MRSRVFIFLFVQNSGGLFPVRETGKGILFQFRIPVLLFRVGKGLDHEAHVSCKVPHGLQTFKVLLHVLGREPVHLVPVSRGGHRHAADRKILVQHVEAGRVAAPPAADDGGSHLHVRYKINIILSPKNKKQNKQIPKTFRLWWSHHMTFS